MSPKRGCSRFSRRVWRREVVVTHGDAIIGFDRDSEAMVWRMGERPTLERVGADGWFSCTHGPDVSGNRLLVYDNRRSLQSSRVLEYAIDPVAATATVTWEWTDSGRYEPAWGDVDHLAEGHALTR